MSLWLSPVLVLLTASAARADMLAELATPFQRALAGGSTPTALGLSYLAGLATALTPCVYPMIAITVSVFGAREVKSKAQGAALSTAFVAGMAVLFTVLGTFAATTGGVFGDELASPWIAGGIAIVFMAMGLSMFGAFELSLPTSLQTKLADAGGVGYRGAFVLGMVSSVIAAPCVGPVLGLLLPWVGSSGRIGLGAACMFSYALGLGTLFWIVGTFAVALPKSGRWTEWVKSVFGLVMVTSALYFVRAWLPGLEHVQRTSGVAIGALSLIAFGLALGAVHLSFSYTPMLERVRKGGGIIATTAGLLLGITYMTAVAPGEKIMWAHDLSHARSLAKTSAKPLLVDFGAAWCGACGELDRHTFSDPRVVAEGRRFQSVRVDLSGGPALEQGQSWLSEYSARGLPLVVLHDKEGREVARVTQFIDAEKMLALMRTVQ